MSPITTDKDSGAKALHTSADAAKQHGDGRFLWPFSRPGFAIVLALATAMMLALFNQFPSIDIAVADHFFVETACVDGADAGRCGSFPAASNQMLNAVRDVLHVLPPALAVMLLVYAVPAGFSSNTARVAHARGAATAVVSLVVSALVLVNFVLKAYSGRPRPLYTDLFGGDLPFVEAGRFSDLCAANCSFVSGEASAGFWLLCLAPLAPRRWRLPALVAALIAAVSASGLRVAFGAHYLSDVTIAAMLSLTIFALLATLGARLGWYRLDQA